jgi:hypothetical protein
MKRPTNPDPSKPEEIELPESAQVVADVIGRDATLQLTKVAKGRKIYIPVTLCAGHGITSFGRSSKETRPRCTCKGHWLAATVGDDLAVLLCRTFGGESLEPSRAKQQPTRRSIKAVSSAIPLPPKGSARKDAGAIKRRNVLW